MINCWQAADDPLQPVVKEIRVHLMAADLSYGSISQGPPFRTFLDGSEYWFVELPTVRIGLGHFRPGWVWSEHAGKQTAEDSQAHIGYIQSGKMAVESADGGQVEIGPGEAFEVGPGHNAWVVGDEMCIALDVTFKLSDN
jgi:hypothetical protein